MYRRYEPRGRTCPPPQSIKQNPPRKTPQPQNTAHKNQTPKPEQKETKCRKEHPLTKFIPQSVYDPKSGKVLGFLSAEDLLLVALILLMIDTDDGETDNSMLVYALIYILISEHIDLPF